MKIKSMPFAFAVSLLGLSAVANAQLTTSFSFDNNSMPEGWGVFVDPGSPGRNVHVQNNRLEIGQVDTYGGIYKSFNSANLQKLQVEYDASISNVYWGEATAARLMNNIANYSSGWAQSSMGKVGYGYPSMNFNIGGQVAGSPAASAYDKTVPAVYGNYHMSATFQDGQISQTVTNLATNQSFSSGAVAVPGFKLNSMNNVALFGVTTTGAPATIDNVKIQTTGTVGRNFGLFIGVNGGKGSNSTELRGDLMAEKLLQAFNSKNSTSGQKTFLGYELTADTTSTDSTKNNISADQIKSTLMDIRSQMNSNDTFTLYVGGHGGSQFSPYTGTGNDGVALGPITIESPPLGPIASGMYYDYQLYDALKAFDPEGQFRKMAFIDACHSGGFWGSSDPEIGSNLDKLKNISLFASAGEYSSMYYGADGLPFYSKALADAFNFGLWNQNQATLAGFLNVMSKSYAMSFSESPEFFEGALGDAVSKDVSLIAPVAMTSADFDVNAPLMNSQLAPIPEPETYAMMLVGLGLLGLTARRRRQKLDA